MLTPALFGHDDKTFAWNQSSPNLYGTYVFGFGWTVLTNFSQVLFSCKRFKSSATGNLFNCWSTLLTYGLHYSSLTLYLFHLYYFLHFVDWWIRIVHFTLLIVDCSWPEFSCKKSLWSNSINDTFHCYLFVSTDPYLWISLFGVAWLISFSAFWLLPMLNFKKYLDVHKNDFHLATLTQIHHLFLTLHQVFPDHYCLLFYNKISSAYVLTRCLNALLIFSLCSGW